MRTESANRWYNANYKMRTFGQKEDGHELRHTKVSTATQGASKNVPTQTAIFQKGLGVSIPNFVS